MNFPIVLKQGVNYLIEGIFSSSRFLEIYFQNKKIYPEKKICVIVRDKRIRQFVRNDLFPTKKSKIELINDNTKIVLTIDEFLELSIGQLPDIAIFDDYTDIYINILYKKCETEFLNFCGALEQIIAVTSSARADGHLITELLDDIKFENLFLSDIPVKKNSENSLKNGIIPLPPEFLIAEQALSEKGTEKLIIDCLAHSLCDIVLITYNYERASYIAGEIEASCTTYGTEVIWQEDIRQMNIDKKIRKFQNCIYNNLDKRKILVMDLKFPLFNYIEKLRMDFNPGIIILEGTEYSSKKKYGNKISRSYPGFSGILLKHQILRIAQTWNKETFAVLTPHTNAAGLEDYFLELEVWFKKIANRTKVF